MTSCNVKVLSYSTDDCLELIIETDWIADELDHLITSGPVMFDLEDVSFQIEDWKLQKIKFNYI